MKRIAALRRAIHLTGMKRSALAIAVMFGSLTLAASVGLSATAAWLIVRADQHPPVLDLSVAVVAVRAFGITRGVSRYLDRLSSHKVALDGMVELRTNLYRQLAAAPQSATVGLRRGDLLARVGADVDDVGDLVVKGIVPSLVAVVLVAGTTLMIGLILPIAGLSLLIFLLVAGLVPAALSIRSTRRAEDMGSRARAEVATTSMSILENASEIRVSGRMGAMVDSLRAGERNLFRANDAAAKPSALASIISELALGASVITAFALGFPALQSGEIVTMQLAVLVLLPLAAFEAVNSLPGAATQMYRSNAAAKRIISMIDTKDPSDREGLDPEKASEIGPGEPLRATDLTCAWPTGPDVLSAVNLTLEPGKAYGIVGASGIGKTTLLATLSGLLPPRAGAVTIANHRMDELGREQAAELVAFIAEDAHIFETTVLENLRVVRGDVTTDEAASALRTAGLSKWLSDLPDGLDTMLGPDGATVSGGERRRLLVARALLTRARFLLLDEPGEHLDSESADALASHLITTAASEGRGIVIVTHRPDSLTDADEVFFLKNGRIAAQGTHRELALCSEDYAQALLSDEDDS